MATGGFSHGSTPTDFTGGSGIATVYAGEASMAYDVGDLFGQAGMIYYGARPTETIKHSIWDSTNAHFKDDGSDHTEENASASFADIPVFIPIKASNRVKYASVDVRPDLNIATQLGRKHGQMVGKTKTISIMCFLAKTADTASNIVTADENATDGTAPDNVAVGIQNLSALLDARNADGPRYGLLKPSAFHKLASRDDVIRIDFGGQPIVKTVARTGFLLQYHGFIIKNAGVGFGTDWTATTGDNMNLPDEAVYDFGTGNSSGDTIGIFWEMNSWALREQTGLQSEIEKIARLQVWQLLTRHQIGMKQLQTDGIAILNQA